MIDYLTIIAVLALGAWVEWRFRQFGRSEAGPLFQCYYCKEMFPIFRRERIGYYDYCPAHGHRRKAQWSADFNNKGVTYDDRARIHSANSGVQQPHNDQFPWLS